MPADHPSWPSVGVVIATRDRPELLRRAVEAVWTQRYPGEVEVLCVFDQAVPDRSLEREGPNRRVRVLTNQRTPGLAGGRNTGITSSDHELVAFCDDDDLWTAGKLAAQVEVLRDSPAMEVVTTGILVDAKGRVTPRVWPRPTITFDDLLESRVMEAHPSTFLARRAAVVDGIGLVDEDIPGSYAEDYDWLLRAARRADLGAVALPLVKVFWHRSSFFAERWQTIISALDYLVAKHPELREAASGLARIEGQQAFAHAALGERREARALARRALARNRRERRAYLALLTSTPLLRTDHVLRALQAFGRGI